MSDESWGDEAGSVQVTRDWLLAFGKLERIDSLESDWTLACLASRSQEVDVFW